MSSKQDHQEQPPCRLLDAASGSLDFELIAVDGRDAADFLQRQTMNDLRTLGDQVPAQRNGLLNAEGRVLHLFVVFHRATGQFVLACPDGDAAAIIAELRRYLFRSKVTLAPCPALQVVGGEGTAPSAESFAWDATRWIALAEVAPAHARDGADWRREDIRAGLVRLPDNARGRYTPHMLGLHRWQAFSLSKGCYPGQEIVSRTHYLGRHKRDLQRVRGAQALAEDAPLFADGREIGRVVCAAGRDALAVLPVGPAQALSAADGSAVEWLA